MTTRTWLTKLFARRTPRTIRTAPTRPRKPSRTRTRLGLETFEPRIVPAATQFSVVPSAPAVLPYTAFGVTVTAEDAVGNTATDYLGPVHFSSSDANASLPADYTFTAADHGVHTFSGVAFHTPGSQTLTASNGGLGAVTEFAIPTASSNSQGITAGPDGNLWFTETSGNKVAKITLAGAVSEYSIPTANSQPEGITAGPDGNLWFVESNGNKVGKITPAGVVTEYPIPTAGSFPMGITASTDGNLWFVEEGGNKVGKITTAGVITEYPIPTAGSFPDGIAAGVFASLWFTELNGNQVGRMTPAGVVTEFPVPTGGSQPEQITAGPSGNLWFTEYAGNQVGKITPLGAVTEYTIPTASSNPVGITAGADGNLWFTELLGNKIGRMTPAGTVTEFPIPTGGSQPVGITGGPDGNLWFVENSSNKVGRITSAALTGSAAVAVPGVATHFVVTTTAANPAVAGTPFSVTVTAQDSHGLTAIGFGGTVHLSSSDLKASLPADYTFTAADHGVHTFSGVVFRGAGGQTLTAASGAVGAITEFTVPTSNSHPFEITAGPDGNLWFTENAGNKVGNFNPAVGWTEFTLPNSGSGPKGITTGPDGNIWFTEFNSNRVGKLTPTNPSVLTESQLLTNSGPEGITVGSDGNLWFTEASGNRVGHVSPAGVGADFTLPTPNSQPEGITAGPKGSIWLTEFGSSTVYFFSPTFGVFDTFSGGAGPYGITVGPDQNLWFTENTGNAVGQIITSGGSGEYPIPTANSQPKGITLGPDGNLWFVEYAGNKVAKITPAGVITEYPIPTPNSGPEGITLGPDGNLWFTEANGNKIGRLTLAVPAGSAPVTVVAAAADHYAATTSAANPFAGTPFSVTVTAQDPYGNTVTGYTGTVHFSSTDPTATLPADYTFTAADNGVHAFSGVVFRRAGGQTLNLNTAVAEFPVPTVDSQPHGITAGPDGNLWFTEYNGNRVTRLTPAGVFTDFFLTVGSGPIGITAGPDGNLWFTEASGDRIGKITPGGAFTEYAIPTPNSVPESIVAGPDGNLWFTELNGNKIGRITPAGAVTEFPIPTANSQPWGIAFIIGNDLGFTESNGNKIGSINTINGGITEFPVPTGGSVPRGITAGPDSLYWFTEYGANKLGHGVLVSPTESPIPTSGSAPQGITTGPDGNIWFTEVNGNQIGRSTPAGVVTEVAVPTGDSGLAAITVGPDGNLWFTEALGNKVGRIGVPLGSASITVRAVPTSISLNASSTSLYAGQNVTLTATVTRPAGDLALTAADGTVTFWDGATQLGSPQPLSIDPATGKATATLTIALTIGAHTITAVYSGDNNFLTSRSGVEPTSAQPSLPTSGLNFPEAVAVDSAGNVFIADTNDNRVVELPNGGAEADIGLYLQLNGSGQYTPVPFYRPYAVTAVSQGDAYVTDSTQALVNSPLGGTPIQIGYGTVAPLGQAFDSQGDVFIADPMHNQVEEIKADGSVPTTVGSGLNQPYGVAVDSSGDVFIADSGNNRVIEVKAGVPVTVSPAPPVTVASVLINDGSAQRSEVRSISVTFSGPVTFAGGNAAAAFQLLHEQTGNNVALTATTATDSLGRTVVTLTFSGAETDPISGLNGGVASLADGRYQLTVLAGKVIASDGSALAGDGTDVGSNYVSPADTYGGNGLHLYRLFGDVNGDGVVDATDVGQLKSTFNRNNTDPLYLWYLDADNSGAVDASDIGQFKSRFNVNVFG